MKMKEKQDKPYLIYAKDPLEWLLRRVRDIKDYEKSLQNEKKTRMYEYNKRLKELRLNMLRTGNMKEFYKLCKASIVLK